MRRELWAEIGLPVEWCAEDAANVDAVLMGGLESEKILLGLKNQPRDVVYVRHIDFLHREHGQVWPRSLLSQALRQIILRSSKGLDLRDWALVTGVSALSRAALVSVFEVGYRQARLVYGTEELEAAEKIKVDFEKYCFGFNIELQKRNELTLQPNNGSLLVNVEDLQQDADLLETLLYMNFIHRPGLVLDLSAKTELGTLLQEAALSKFEAVAGFHVQAEWDYLLLQSLKVKLKFTVDEYLKLWLKKLGDPKLGA